MEIFRGFFVSVFVIFSAFELCVSIHTITSKTTITRIGEELLGADESATVTDSMNLIVFTSCMYALWSIAFGVLAIVVKIF